jgi:hypothetical protein
MPDGLEHQEEVFTMSSTANTTTNRFGLADLVSEKLEGSYRRAKSKTRLMA